MVIWPAECCFSHFSFWNEEQTFLHFSKLLLFGCHRSSAQMHYCIWQRLVFSRLNLEGVWFRVTVFHCNAVATTCDGFVS